MNKSISLEQFGIIENPPLQLKDSESQPPKKGVTAAVWVDGAWHIAEYTGPEWIDEWSKYSYHEVRFYIPLVIVPLGDSAKAGYALPI